MPILVSLLLAYLLACPLTDKVELDLTQTEWTNILTYIWIVFAGFIWVVFFWLFALVLAAIGAATTATVRNRHRNWRD